MFEMWYEVPATIFSCLTVRLHFYLKKPTPYGHYYSVGNLILAANPLSDTIFMRTIIQLFQGCAYTLNLDVFMI